MDIGKSNNLRHLIEYYAQSGSPAEQRVVLKRIFSILNHKTVFSFSVGEPVFLDGEIAHIRSRFICVESGERYYSLDNDLFANEKFINNIIEGMVEYEGNKNNV